MAPKRHLPPAVKDAERSKKTEDSQKPLSQKRQWTKEDEVAILQGIITFFAAEGKAPSQDMMAFHDFIKGSLHFELTVDQLSEKIDGFMGKFHTQVKGKGGEDKVFKKPHYQTIFNLSKRIWGNDSVMDVRDRMGIERNIEKSYKFDSSANLKKKIDYALSNGYKFVNGPKKAELKKKYRKLQALEWLLCKKQLEFIAELAGSMQEFLDPDVLSMFQ